MTRRDIFGIAGAGALAVAQTEVGRAATEFRPEFKLGVCTYSFHEFQRKMTISLIKQLGVSHISVKDFHLSYFATADEIAKAKGDFKRAGLIIASGGTIDLKDEDPALLRRSFDYARNCGMPLIVAAPTAKTIPMVEKLAKEYDIKVAIHNHGPEDQNFPTPKSVLDAVAGLDPRMGLCMDLGHSMRTGADVVQEIANAGTRLLDIHIKDLTDPKDKKSQCDVGDGKMPIVAIFKQLVKMSYKGCVDLEYEINSDNPVPGMLHSLGYMKGVLAGLAG
jgi:sugar phosphate isomerase/epimerase